MTSKNIFGFVCSILLVGTAQVQTAQVPYGTDFEGGIGPEWSASTTEGPLPYFTQFAGRFTNNTQSLTLTNLAIGTSYTIGFDFYVIDSWDGNAGSGDALAINVNSNQVFRETFSNTGTAQTFPQLQDEGRAHFGFGSSFVDSVYRNIEAAFVASNSTAVISFTGQNLSAISDESWGIDNVTVNLTSALGTTTIRSSTLPSEGSTNSTAIEGFAFSASRPLLASTANNSANYNLREAGVNGNFGDGDDVIFALTPSFTNGRTANFTISNGPLQPGKYRFQTATGLQDTNSSSVQIFTRNFTVAHPVLGKIENTSNDTQAGATALPTTESPVGSGFLTAFAEGTFSAIGDVDFWRFDAEAGDQLTVRLEAVLLGVHPQLQLRNAAGQNLQNIGGNNEGIVGFQSFAITSPGTYYLRVFSNNARSAYRMRVDQARGLQLENEGNDTQVTANPLSLAFSSGFAQAKVVGSLLAEDAAGDFFRLGNLNVGNAINVNALFPNGSSLNTNSLVLSVQLAGNPVALTTNNSGSLNYTVLSDGVYYVRVESTNRVIRSQYLLDLAITDGVAPIVTATSLPAEGSATEAIVDGFTLSFSEEMNRASVTNPGSYSLRFADVDGLLDTADDSFYIITNDYVSGLVASFVIADGPLQPGKYRFTANGSLLDRASNPLNPVFIRHFSVTNSSGFPLENRANDLASLGSSMTFTPGSNGDGTISLLGSTTVGTQPYFVVTGHFNNDTNIDLATANYNGDGVSVLLNNGKGEFQNATNILTGDGAISLVGGDFNNDAKKDFAVANYSAGTISLLMGNGVGGFQSFSNYTGFSSPYNLAAADINLDGKLDLVVPNYSSANLSVLLGNGDGTFQTKTNYAVGSNPETAMIGDLNHDGILDIVVANYSSASLSVLFGNGNGSFQAATNLTVGTNPRSVAIGDVTGDGTNDLVVLHVSDNTVGILRGNGNGTFQQRIDYNTTTTDAYQLILADLNSDLRSDIVVPGYGNNRLTIFLNDGAGGFTNSHSMTVSGNPISAAAADYNNDGRNDVAFANYNQNTVTIWLGNGSYPLTENPVTSGLKTGLARGNLSSDSDVDFYQFSGTAGDLVMLAVDIPGNPSSSSLRYRIERTDGTILTQFVSASTGAGQSAVVTLPHTGTYIVRVSPNNDYRGEYRLRITTIRPPMQFESEPNNTTAQATKPSLTLTNGQLQAAVAGYLSRDDAGDIYNFGNLGASSVISLNLAQPASSGFAGVLEIYNSLGAVVATSALGESNLVYAVPAGQDGIYYGRLTMGTSGYNPTQETALRFDGSDDSADLGAWFNYQSFTISMWVNAGSSQVTFADLLDNNHQGGINWVIQQNGGSVNNYTWGNSDGSPAIPFSLAANQWQHLTVTRDASGTNCVYLNGVLVGSASGTGAINYNGNQFLRLARWGGGARNWNGMIDELRIWNTALTASQVVTNMTGDLMGNESGLVGYWRFNEGTGTTASDLSSSGRTITLVNGPAWTSVSSTAIRSPGILAQYILNIDLQDAQAPSITGDTLPLNASSTSNIITRFNVSFSEEMDAAFNGLNRVVSRFAGHSYLITDATGSWQSAQTQALALGGNLVAINSQAENDWVNQTYSGFGNLWIGLSDQVIEGNFVWASGEPLSYTNWVAGQPDNSSGEDLVQMLTSGRWNDIGSGNLRGVIEFSNSTDSDGDGLVDLLDPYPNDALNGFDLRAAGVDGLFGTSDDRVYDLDTTGYVSGLTATFLIVDGPLQSGDYRFTVTTAVKDRSGNGIVAPYVRNFTIIPVTNLTLENQNNGSPELATSLSVNPTNTPDGSFFGLTNLAVGQNPYFIVAGQFGGDTNVDLITANYNSDNISLLLGNGNGTFQSASNFVVGDGPISMVVGSFNQDTHLDVAVANEAAHTVTVLFGNGAGGFLSSTNYSVGSSPRRIISGDFNNDGRLDLATANQAGNNVSILLATADGGFSPRVNYATASGTHHLVTGDLNGDGQLDLVAVNYNANTLSVLLGNIDGTFQTSTSIPAGSNPRAIVVGRINGDTNLDLVVYHSGDNTLSLFVGNGDGTFQPRVNFTAGLSDVYQLVLADINLDGTNDLVIPSYGNNGLVTMLNNGEGNFGNATSYALAGNPISAVVHDLNADGRPDIATANYGGHNLSVLLGKGNSLLTEDPADSGIRFGGGRGNLSDINDWDYWTFSGNAGDRLSVASDVPGNPSSSSLTFAITRPDGGALTSFTSDSRGWGQSPVVTLPVSGTYFVRVSYNNEYYSEYRLRVTLVRPPVQIESENNNSIGTANTLAYAFSAGHQQASVFGYISFGDSNGDYYRLGNLALGTTINLNLSKPSTSLLSPIIGIYNSAGTLVTNTIADATNLVFNIPSGGDDSYFARVTAASGNSLFAQYLLNIDLADTLPPSIAGDNLPGEGLTVSNIIDRFSLNFSEDMTITNVTNPANYELRNAGADTLFGTSDDSIYGIINSPAYGSGLSATYLITNGPLQPGKYRFTASANLTDRSGNPLTTAYVRSFTMTNGSGFVFENRSNDSHALATSLSVTPTNLADGSFVYFTNVAVGSRPYYLATGNLNSDTNLDLVVANFDSANVSVLIGNGNGSFQTLTNYPTAAGAIAPLLGRFNADSHLDLAVVNYTAGTINVFLGNGNGTFQISSNYTVGTQPYNITSADFNGDGALDLATANVGTDNVSVLLGNGDGTFQARVNYPAGDGPQSIVVGDVNGDNKVDIVTANSNSDNLSLLLGNGNGTFASAISMAANLTPRSVALADFNNDEKLDLAAINAGDNTISLHFGNGDGSFQPRITFAAATSDSYHIVASDLNDDGVKDLVVGSYNGNSILAFINRGGGNFESPVSYSGPNRPIGLVIGDFSNDGLLDIAAANYSGNNVTVILGADTELLTEDGSIRYGIGRGKLSSGNDVDYWSFSASAGDRLFVGVENPGNPSSSSLRYLIYGPNDVYLGDFYGDGNGRGQRGMILAQSGTYSIKVVESQAYIGEYRLRVTLAKEPVQIEAEANNTIGAADTLSLPLNGGHQTATVLGAIASGDTGDYSRLGNLGAGTVINLNYSRPQSSSLVATLKVYNSAGVAVATSAPGETNLAFTISAPDQYFANISAVSNSGLMALYFLNIDIADAVAPAITDVTLPPEASTNSIILDRFSISFNKDMDSGINGLNRSIQLYNGHAYILTSATATWLASENQAREVGGHLVTINDALENNWLRATFAGDFWIGLTDESQEGNFVWSNGEALSYTNWNGSEPNNSGNEDYVAMGSNGRWVDVGLSTKYRAIIEVNGSDIDGDQIPDTLDPYPNDLLNVFDLRSAGVDGIFDTGDDEPYRITAANYTSGLSLDFSVVDGPLQPGNYRFRVTPSLRDKFGNGLASNYDRYFYISAVANYTLENRSNNTVALATPLNLVEELPGMKTIGARGNVANGSDVDYWSFTGTAGELFMLSTGNPGNPGSSQLRYEVFRPDGTRIIDFYPAAAGGVGQIAPLALPSTGTYTIALTHSQGYTGEYRFRVNLTTPPLVIENEDNGTIGTANPITLAVNGDSRFGSLMGYVRNGTDNDYVNLGTLTNGSTVFLSVRQPGFSQLIPVVSIYNAANVYQNEAGSGRASDGVAEVRITQTGVYYAVVRGSEGISGLNEQYILDVQVLPTGSVSFPNLQVVTVNPPSGSGIQSGQQVTFSFAVQNVGSLATPGANWADRVVMSANTILGDNDDIALGVFPHTGALNPSGNYNVIQTVTLPQGISGDYYVIVQTDSGNAVNEFILEGDNITVSSSTFNVTRAPYADLRVENLLVSGPDTNHVFTITWNTANRGNLAAPGGFRETLLVRNQTTGAILLNTAEDIANPLAINATLPHVASVTTTNPGNYLVQVNTDSRDDIYEFDATSHASAEQNTFTANFQIVQYFTIAAISNPTNAGTLNGAGVYASGTTVSLHAMVNTNVLPYSFVNWTENGTFQSASTNYPFTATRNRQLIANFILPSYQIVVSNNPTNAGLVTGAGTYFYGTTNVLTAHPNPGYRFTNWTENSVAVGTNLTLTTVVYTNRSVVANYVEANPFHDVTTATLPAGLASVTGAGFYTNGQTGQFTAPLSVTNPPSVYAFKRFTLNGANFGTNANFTKTFSTVDSTNLHFVAEYDTQSILPLVTNVVANIANPVPLTTNFALTFRFNRSMQTSAVPTVLLTNTATAQQIVRTNGAWSSTVSSNDTFAIAPVTFSAGMDGTFQVFISGARDLSNGQLASTNVTSVVVDATAPLNPNPSVLSSNAFSAVVAWTNYVAPGDLASFRVYVQTNNFSSVAALTPLTGLSSATRQYQLNGLTLDTRYYVAIIALDAAGNSTPTVTPLQVVLPSTIPPAVTIQVSASGLSSAAINWSGYNTSGLFGFAGFRLFYEETNFTSVAGLTIRSNLATHVRSAQVSDLDRTKTYYFAVVGVNGTNGFNPNVTTASWSDPFAGTIASNTTIGGAGQNDVVINQSIVVTNNAVLTIVPGTTLRFAPGAEITINQGRLIANGTALDPIIFTSVNDVTNQTPTAGAWNGIVLNSGAANSILRHVWVKYGAGLTINGVAPTLDAYTALYNAPHGLALANGAAITTSDALLRFNGIGARQSDTAVLNIRNSVLKNNGTNVFAAGSATLIATQNWWGTTVSGDITGQNSGFVNAANFLTFEPLLTPAVGTVGNVTQVGSRDVTLRFACRTADAMRVSEDSSFTGVFFAPFAAEQAFQLSEGGGQKTVYAQFRSVTGQTNAPVSVAIQYLTAGPVIQSFSLSEGQALSRPIVVNGSASAALGVSEIEFYLDNVLQSSAVGGSYSQRFDVRNVASGIHRVKLLARDNSDNFSTLERNVYVNVTPPPAPVITIPASNLIVTTNRLSISGTAEPLVEVRVSRNGQVVGNVIAATNGTFAVTNISLVEGQNSIVATAFDAIGDSGSASRDVVLDSGAPAQLIMNAPVYRPNAGLDLSWRFPATGERATRFQLFWHTAPFATTNQATGQSLSLNFANYTVQGLANGTYYFGVVGFDGAGNASPLSALVSFNYDGTAPTFNVTYDKVPPLGVGAVQLTLNASEALSGNPSLTLTPFGSSTPILIPLTNASLTTYSGTFNVTTATPSGLARLNVTARDLSSNLFSGVPSGAAFLIDVAAPIGFITTAPAGPVQTATPTNVTVNLLLSEAPKSGTTPTLVFTPPTNSPVTLTVSGSGTNWTAPLTLNNGMGSGFGRFALSVRDNVENLGTNLTSGATLEIYNSALPAAPSTPTNLLAQTLTGGSVRLTWNAVSNAEIYRLYRESGTNAVVPTLLIADNIISNAIVDLPAVDGSYRYAVSASRRGSESSGSNLVVAVSDRTPPLAPTNLTVQLVSAGIQISWAQPTNNEAVSSFRIYRNGTLIRTVNSVAPIIDAPPRGLMEYVVAAADAAGNESASAPASIQLLVGAVNNLQALVNIGQAPELSWTSSDVTAVGFNVYRNGAKVNGALVTTTSFTDTQYSGASLAQYSVRAVNASNDESAPRTVDVHRVEFGFLINAAGGTTNLSSAIGYFDQYRTIVSNLTATGSLPLRQLEIRRSISGVDPLNSIRVLNQSIAAGSSLAQDIVAPSASVLNPQSLRLRAIQETDIGGSSAIYQQTIEFTQVETSASMIEVYANQLPLAGGLSPFQVRIFNRGHAAMDFVTTRNNGSEAGDVYISVKNAQGQEVGRTEFNGTPSGTTFLGDGRGYVRIAPGNSIQFTVPNVLVPASLASNLVTFEAVVGKIYHRVGTAEQLESGPLRGSMVSSLAETEYYGTLQTDSLTYANETPVIITGQAINRVTGLPMPNAALKIGFGTRGYRWYREVTTDSNGHYEYTYHPTPGLSGTLTLWAAHPLVFDTLNQAQIDIFRLYASPPRADVRMSKNDTFDFSISLVNPGDLTLTNFTASVRAYTLNGTNQTPITSITGTALLPSNFGFAPKQTRSVTLELTAATNAPDNAVVEFTLTSGEGAAATFVANITLLPAIPVITVVDPTVGYVETSLDRGTLQSRTVTIANRGLRELQGIELIPPTNVLWMNVNLPVSPDGKIRLPDLGVGESNSFQVVFAPPAETTLDYYQDSIRIRGTNSVQEFSINLFALITSDQKGSVQFHVDNILGQHVPNATIRLRNILLQTELPPVLTDSNGLVTVTNMQEGQWSWQASAPGHSSTVGSVEVIPNQIVQVDTRLSKSLVTVTFQVVPVPFTDKYEIKIEQTFETHVPAPVLVIDPAFREFKNVTPGFEANFIATAKNHGLIEMTDVHITGSSGAGDALTPLITYFPVLLPQQVVEVPFRFTHGGESTGSQGENRQFSGGDLVGCIGGGLPLGVAGFLNPDVARGLGAIFNAQFRCVSDQQRADLMASLAVVAGISLAADVFMSAADFVGAYVGNVISCIAGNLLASLPGIDTSVTGPGPRTEAKYDVERLQCFVAGTPVTMADGTRRAIETIRTNDLVRTGPNSGEVATVVEVHSRTVEQTRELEIQFSGAEKRVIELHTTDEHLIWVDGKGWIGAGALKSGDWLFTETGERVQVIASRSIKKPTTVYTFKNREDSAFYANGILVHDMCGIESTRNVVLEVAR